MARESERTGQNAPHCGPGARWQLFGHPASVWRRAITNIDVLFANTPAAFALLNHMLISGFYFSQGFFILLSPSSAVLTAPRSSCKRSWRAEERAFGLGVRARGRRGLARVISARMMPGAGAQLIFPIRGPVRPATAMAPPWVPLNPRLDIAPLTSDALSSVTAPNAPPY